MKKLNLIIALLWMFAGSSYGQVTNYAIQLNPGSEVRGGIVSELQATNSYTIQFWLSPAHWDKGAVVMRVCDNLSVELGESGKLKLIFDKQEVDIPSSDLAEGQWAQVTILSTNGKGEAFINHSKVKDFEAPSLVAESTELTLGGTYQGRIDEVRIWKDALTPEYDYLWNTTLNKWAPQWDDLVVYYKFDQYECAHIVDYKAILANTANNHHGVMEGEAQREKVTDNPKLPYLFSGAYCNNERFYDRGVSKEQYLLSNDLIILGIRSFPDGHLKYKTPCNHAQAENCTYLDEFKGRSGVLQLNGNGSKLTCTKETLTPEILKGIASAGYTFEAWVYIDEWTEGAYLFRKETSDAKNGFSIRLGDMDHHQLIVRCNGNDFVNQNALKVGQWVYVGITTNQGQEPSTTFLFSINGESCWADPAVSTHSTSYTPLGMDDCVAYIGEGFKGKLDDVAIWDRKLSNADMDKHRKEGCPMPALGKVVTAALMKNCNTYYRFDNRKNIGYDSYSQDSWRDIMTSAYDGYRGWHVRISVESHKDWQTTIADAAKRKIFAEDLARLSEGYDGVELDLEWEYKNWTNYGLLAEEIRKALPAGKTFQISNHNVSYKFPVSQMQNVDGFTFQQYGPQKMHFSYSKFEEMAKAFLQYGYPKDKVVLSYATTTSKGYLKDQPKTPIKGVRNNFLNENFIPNGEVDFAEQDGYTYYFCGPLQAYKRARFCTSNNMKGIFYWDMGNDVPVDHPYNMAKWVSYGLNANVDPIVASVTPHYPTGIKKSDSDPVQLMVSSDGMMKVSGGKTVKQLFIYSIDGMKIAGTPSDSLSIKDLRKNNYIVKIVFEGGQTESIKWMKCD